MTRTIDIMIVPQSDCLFFEAQIENTASGPLYLEKVTPWDKCYLFQYYYIQY